MSAAKRRKPVTPTFIVLLGIIMLGVVIGLAGLAMLVLGVGAATPTTLQIPNINLNVSTSSLPIVVMAAGLGVGVAALGLLVRYTTAYNKGRHDLIQEWMRQQQQAPQQQAPQQQSVDALREIMKVAAEQDMDRVRDLGEG